MIRQHAGGCQNLWQKRREVMKDRWSGRKKGRQDEMGTSWCWWVWFATLQDLKRRPREPDLDPCDCECHTAVLHTWHADHVAMGPARNSFSGMYAVVLLHFSSFSPNYLLNLTGVTFYGLNLINPATAFSNQLRSSQMSDDTLIINFFIFFQFLLLVVFRELKLP